MTCDTVLGEEPVPDHVTRDVSDHDEPMRSRGVLMRCGAAIGLDRCLFES